MADCPISLPKPFVRLKNYHSLFTDLLKQATVPTLYPIISMFITYDSTRALTVTQKDARECYIKMYDVESYALCFEERVGGGADQYIKMKDVE